MLVTPVGEPREFRSQVAQIALGPLDRRQPHGHHALLATLSKHHERSERLVEVVDLERADFACTQAACVHQLEHAAVAQPESAAGRGIGRLDELAHLPDAQRAGHALPFRRAVDQSRRVLRDPALGVHPAEVDAHRGQVTRDARRLHAALARQLLDVLGHVRHRHGTRVGDALACEETPEVAQVSGVRLDGGRRQTGFDAAEGKELAHAGSLRRWRGGNACGPGAVSWAWSRGLAHGIPSVRASCPAGGCARRPRGRSWHAVMPRG